MLSSRSTSHGGSRESRRGTASAGRGKGSLKRVSPSLKRASPRSGRALGADDPAPQLASLPAREPQAKGVIRRFEQVMALVEHIARRHRRIVEPAQGRLGHHQRMIRDDDPRLARRADILFDKAAAEMRAGGMNAFPAPIGQRIDPAAADQLGEPAREIAGHQITGIGCGDPAGDQPQLRQ